MTDSQRVEKHLFAIADNAGKYKYRQIILGQKAHPKLLPKSSPPAKVPMRTDSFGITCFIRGKGTMILNGRVYLMEKNDLCFLEPHVRQLESYYNKNTGYEKLDIFFLEAFRLRIVHVVYEPETGGSRYLASLTIKVKPQMIHLLEGVFRIKDPKKEFHRVRSIIQEFFRELAGRLKEKDYVKKIFSEDVLINETIKRKRLERIKEYIEAHYKEKVRVIDLAQKLSITPRYLSVLYRQMYGFRITEYIVNLRLRKAKTLLKNTNMSINNIAVRVGYPNPVFFREIFKKYMEITPRKFRLRSQKAGAEKTV